MPWWVWALVGWLGVAMVVALPLARFLREADRRDRGRYAGVSPVQGPRTVTSPDPSRARKRIPLPPVAVTLVGVGVTLEAVGFVLRAADRDRGAARVLSMDLPFSLPRLYITALFAAAAVAALIGATRAPGRRAWWAAVGLVAAAVVEVKSGGMVHVRALAAFGVSDRPVLAALGSTVVVGAVLGALWWLSRTERRDRRRILSAFALYSLASVGLSAVSSVVGQSLGDSPWLAVATFVEESGEVLGAVAVLLAVLLGVAPRLVLPAAWALSRAADAETIDAPGALPNVSPGSLYLRG